MLKGYTGPIQVAFGSEDMPGAAPEGHHTRRGSTLIIVLREDQAAQHVIIADDTTDEVA
jgi:hypothetical protein